MARNLLGHTNGPAVTANGSGTVTPAPASAIVRNEEPPGQSS
jgi:hypothetical protein